MPPDNQAWGDYVGVRIVLQTVAATRSIDAQPFIQHLEGGASFDILKERKASFRTRDHQLLQEMYVLKVKDKTQSKDKWDVFDLVRAVPGPRGSLDTIQPTEAENPCKMT
jgi:branched-chain amino acid transport system substrate-binding protein